jgi:NitT/TauT family transport system permease protein
VRAKRIAAVVLPPLGVAGLAIGVWYFVTYQVIDPGRRFLLPPPQDVIHKGFGNDRVLHDILRGVWETTKVSLEGLAIAIAGGLLVAIVMVQARWLERMLFPWAVVLQTIPILAITPLIGIWWGFGVKSQVIVCVLIALFPIITNTLFGLRSVEPGQHDLFDLHGAGRLTRLAKLQLPASLPAVFTGFRISAGLSVIGAIVGEFFFQQGTSKGLGELMILYQNRTETERLITAILFACALGLALFIVVTWIGNRLTRDWRQEVRRTRPAGGRLVGVSGVTVATVSLDDLERIEAGQGGRA